MGWIRDLGVWATKAVAARILGSVVMALLAGTEVRALFAGNGRGLGLSFVPSAVGVLSGIAVLVLFLFVLRVWPRQVPTTTPAVPAKTFPDLAQIVSEVRAHNERVAAARDAKPVNCARCGREVPKWFICPMPNETMSDRSFWLKTHPNLGWTPKEREGFITDGGIGCMVCAVTAPVYPADGETKEEFTKRVLSARSADTSPPEGTSQ